MPANPSLIDTMARAIANTGAVGDHWADLSPPDRDDYRREARAALRSLLEAGPTEAMVRAAAKQIELTDLYPIGDGGPDGWWMQWQDCAREAFTAAMRAALEEADNHG